MSIKIKYEGAANIRKAISSVCNRTSSVQNDIQQVAISCLAHCIQHGDWTLSAELIDGYSKVEGAGKTALRKWHEAFMHATFDNKTASFTYDDGHDATTIALEQAAAVNWWAFKPEQDNTTKTFAEYAEQMRKNLVKGVKGGTVEADIAAEVNEYLTRKAFELEAAEQGLELVAVNG